MTTHQLLTADDLAQIIQACASEQFTGRLALKIEDIYKSQWNLHFSGGNLFWCTSQVHPVRRLERQLLRHCPQIASDHQTLVTLRAAAIEPRLNHQRCPDYDALTIAVKQGKIHWEQMAVVVEGNIIEILFDIIQWVERLRYRSGDRLIYQQFSQKTQEAMLVLMPAEQAWRQAMKVWEAWQRAGLSNICPNLAPKIVKAEELQRQTSPRVYQNLISLANGTQSFRDLAVKLNRNLLLLTQPIVPYIQKGIIQLIELENISNTVKQGPVNYSLEKELKNQEQKERNAIFPVINRTAARSSPQPTSPLIACIDDSRIDSLTMSQILTQAGYQCLNIQDPVQALVQLLEKKPDLIFLDLIMPVANGYEICAQIRRVSILKDTPVIILTSNDGIVDRVRAKMVGSSGFLAKPINAEKVLTTLQKHLLISSTSKVPNAANEVSQQSVKT